MSYLSLVKAVSGIFNAANTAYDGYKAVKWVINKSVRRRAEKEIRLGKKAFRNLLNGKFLEYLLYISFNVLLLASICFISRMIVAESQTLLAAGYTMIVTRMTLSGWRILMFCYGCSQNRQVRCSVDGVIYGLLDVAKNDRSDNGMEQDNSVQRWFHAKLGLADSVQKIVVEGVWDTVRKETLRFVLCFSLALTTYVVITGYFALPLMAGLEDKPWWLAHSYPFYASPCILAETLMHPATGGLFAILFCCLFARTTWCVHRRYGALGSFLAWLLFLVITAAVLHKLHFTEIWTILFIQTVLTAKKCVTGYYIHPE